MHSVDIPRRPCESNKSFPGFLRRKNPTLWLRSQKFSRRVELRECLYEVSCIFYRTRILRRILSRFFDSTKNADRHCPLGGKNKRKTEKQFLSPVAQEIIYQDPHKIKSTWEIKQRRNRPSAMFEFNASESWIILRSPSRFHHFIQGVQHKMSHTLCSRKLGQTERKSPLPFANATT